MKIYAKSLSLSKSVVTMKFHRDGTYISKDHASALYALSGGYNETARGVDLDQYEAIKKRFESAVDEMAAAIVNAERG